MNITQIEEIVKKLAVDINNSQVNKDEFIYQLMAAYGHRKTTIGRIKSGERNLAKVEGEVRAKRHIYFKQSQNDCVLLDIDNMKKEPSVTRDKIRFVIATDFNQFVAIDTRTHDTLDIEFNELGKHFDFFLPWAGMEKAVYQGENPADVKAAEKMAKLFDLIKADNFSEENKDDTTALHNLNVFLTRLLFCFFAEDTGIFKQNQFSGELESHTKVDGSDVNSYLNRLFEVLNTSKENRGDLPDYLANFEFVNGGLFASTIASPRFATKSRKMLIECGSELDWSDINPDIFGSMIQAVVHPDQRGGMGMHYTSVTNIMKVIEPLFLDELYAEFENIEDNIDAKLKPSRLRKLHERIAEIKLFDPACGSGNFLIIAFKELRKLEMEIIKRLQELDQNDNQDDLFGDVGLDSSFSRIKLSQFYGIELDDFAHEVAILSLWLAEHQMNVEFKAEFGECEPTLPLQNGGHIICGNATRLNWDEVCTKINNPEIFIIGNPPYLGFKMQNAEHKLDIEYVFQGIKNYKKLDYISCWWFLAAKYIRGIRGKASFVSTNSICQGEHVGLLWPEMLNQNIEISFAHKSFKWKNSAKDNAGVICIILGLQNQQEKPKYLYEGYVKRKVSNINPYLSSGENIVVNKLSSPISNFPKMSLGNMPKDDGNFILSKDEKDTLIASTPKIKKFIKKLIGALEFIRGSERWCIWIEDEFLEEALQIPEIVKRVEAVRKFRADSTDKSANKMALTAHKFREQHVAKSHSVIIPTVTSERRDYIPLGILNVDTVIVAPNNALYDPSLDVIAVISSRMHMTWVRTVAGRLKTDYRYSSVLCYNTFPFPKITEATKTRLVELLLDIFSLQESYVGKTIAELYDPLKMPKDLLQAHKNLDKAVEQCYQNEPFKDDSHRLDHLFDLYSEMTGGQNA
ncbi:class I SAM-dependent DNA methyltransferase [Colwellia sp. M166]|uniref:DNA methyltransferase n=1 Tax=Colwellia sp. M166 TaxID=2583805 RepID=UPI00211E20E8|nr:DNA methyltransferase [Colwellia sp. M166]UUO22041.1 class I SAM-dependent DNA methyltransferase [Colwellia sp. M166]